MLIVFIRAILLYLLIIFALRLMGKRQIGELQPSELSITILISNMATLPIEDSSIPMLMGAIPILALVGFELLLSAATLKSKRLRKVISGISRHRSTGGRNRPEGIKTPAVFHRRFNGSPAGKRDF